MCAEWPDRIGLTHFLALNASKLGRSFIWFSL